jgi:surface antigen
MSLGGFKMVKLFSVLSISALVLLSGCSNQMGQREGAGTLLGAIAGGLLGSQIGEGDTRLFAVGAGTLLGAMVGGEIGRSLDATDRLLMERTAGRAFEYSPSDTTVGWRNPDTGHSGTYTPQNVIQQPNSVCREFQQTVTIGGRTEEAYGTACRQADGTWMIVS